MRNIPLLPPQQKFMKFYTFLIQVAWNSEKVLLLAGFIGTGGFVYLDYFLDKLRSIINCKLFHSKINYPNARLKSSLQ